MSTRLQAGGNCLRRMVTKGTEIDRGGCVPLQAEWKTEGLRWGQVTYGSLIDCFRFNLTLLEVIKQSSELRHHRKDK